MILHFVLFTYVCAGASVHACKIHWLLMIGLMCRGPSLWVTAPPGTVSVSITAEDAVMCLPTPSTLACHCVWWTVPFNSFPQTHTYAHTLIQSLSLCSCPCLFLSHTQIHTSGCTHGFTHTQTHPGANSLWAECLLCVRYRMSAQSFGVGYYAFSLFCVREKDKLLIYSQTNFITIKTAAYVIQKMFFYVLDSENETFLCITVTMRTRAHHFSIPRYFSNCEAEHLNRFVVI